MKTATLEIAGPGPLAVSLRERLAGFAFEGGLLVSADPVPDAAMVVFRCRAFVAGVPAGCEALVVTILHAAQTGLDRFGHHAANAALWAFTQQAALEWGARRVRVNAIGLGASPAGPFEATEQSGRTAAAMPAAPASLDDIARTIRAIAAWPSMTGQIIRLGT